MPLRLPLPEGMLAFPSHYYNTDANHNPFSISDTTRVVLIRVWYFLAKYPQQAEKLLSELRDVNERDANVLALLPHLKGVINEALRQMAAQLTGSGRIAGPEGFWVDKTWILGGVKVTALRYIISRREFTGLVNLLFRLTLI
jgi:cytochrome P450